MQVGFQPIREYAKSRHCFQLERVIMKSTKAIWLQVLSGKVVGARLEIDQSQE